MVALAVPVVAQLVTVNLVVDILAKVLAIMRLTAMVVRAMVTEEVRL